MCCRSRCTTPGTCCRIDGKIQEGGSRRRSRLRTFRRCQHLHQRLLRMSARGGHRWSLARRRRKRTEDSEGALLETPSGRTRFAFRSRPDSYVDDARSYQEGDPHRVPQHRRTARAPISLANGRHRDARCASRPLPRAAAKTAPSSPRPRLTRAATPVFRSLGFFLGTSIARFQQNHSHL